MVTYGERIKEERLKHNYTQAQLGELCGISKRSIIAIENNQAKPRNSTVEKLAAIFNVTTDYLMGYSDESQDKFEEIKGQISEALFAGGIYSDEDKEKFFAAFTKAYNVCKKEAKKRAEEKLKQ